MRIKILLIPILILAMVSMACGFTINLPQVKTIDTGPTITEDIVVPKPDTTTTPTLEINFGAGELTINPGAQANLVEGTATYNVPDLKPTVVQNGSTVTLRQGTGNISGIPTLNNKLVMKWDLQLSSDPMELAINGGANQSQVELGGLSLTNLTINQGAADSRYEFSEPNLVNMESLKVNAGAANINLIGLSNANVTDEIIFKGGAGNYTLDFSGELQHDVDVTIEAGLGNMNILVPEGTSVTLNMTGALNNVNYSGGWQKTGDTYSQVGSGPQITIDITMGAGNLDLHN
jgi:hypothetical protein